MSFDRLAPIYGRMERVFAGGKMQRCRTAFLDSIPAPRSTLLAGEGPGRFLAALRRRFPETKITCVDASAGMIDQARRQLDRSGIAADRINFLRADVLSWNPPPGQFDLIVTHFFLDCFLAEQLAALIPRLADSAKPGANWLVADFQIAPAGWRRIRSRVVLTMLYAFFRAATRLPARSLTQPDSLLESRGFRLQRRIESDHGLLRSDWWMRR